METRQWLPKSWVPDGHKDPFILVEILSEANGMASIKLPSGVEMSAPTAVLSPAQSQTTPDMSMLMNLSEATVLDNLLRRLGTSEPYTYTGEVGTPTRSPAPLAVGRTPRASHARRIARGRS